MKKAIKHAFISVFHKENGLDLIVKKLDELGVSISSTGGTADFIQSLGIPVIKAETITGYPSILGGRVKTLHPKIMGGILARRDNLQDIAQLEQYQIPQIDLIIVDLYPFEQTVASGASHDEIVEKIDIGGISLIRAAAKNYNDVSIVASMDQYPVLLNILQKQGAEITEEQRYEFATEAFVTASVYDLAIAMYFGQGDYYGIIGKKVRDLRYGENPWQKSYGLFKTFGGGDDPLALCNFQVIAGQFGHVNWLDLDRMLQTMTHIMAGYHKNNLWKNMHQLNPGQSPYVAIGAKHGNPCGASISSTPERALMDMLDGNLTSIFGGAIMTNFVITQYLAEIIRNYHSEKTKRILDVVVAPGIDEEAKQLLRRKNDSCKMAIKPALLDLDIDCLDKEPIFRKVRGSELVQQNYDLILDLEADYISKYGITKMPSGQDLVNLVLAWAVCATSNSNTIVLVKDKMLIGAGVGQMDRLECCDLAVRRAHNAGHDILGSVACSDSFFPFSDGPAKLIDAGVEAIFTTSGSVKDQDTIDLCSERNVPLLMIPNSLGRMFFGH